MSDFEELTAAVNELTTILKQGILEFIDARPVSGLPEKAIMPPLLADEPPLPEPAIEEFPAFQAQATAKPPSGGCPTHHEPWKYVPPGVSKSSGKPYEGFWARPERGCRERPR